MQPEEFLKTVDERNAQKNKSIQEQQKQANSILQTNAIIGAITQATQALIKFQVSHKPEVSVNNQKLPISIKTPDIQKVVDALENLKQPLQENKPDDTKIIEALGLLNDSVSKLPITLPIIPKPIDSVTVKNQPDYKPEFNKLAESISKIDVKPVINIPAEQPEDYSAILESLSNVIEAIEANKPVETPETDLTPLIQATAAVQQSIQNLKFPVANYVLPFKNTDGKATQVQLDANGVLPVSDAILTNRYDYASSPIYYTATASVGVSDSATGWTITKYDLSDTSNASGKIATDVSWTNRATGSYN